MMQSKQFSEEQLKKKLMDKATYYLSKYASHSEKLKIILLNYIIKNKISLNDDSRNKFIDYKTQTYDKLPERFWIIYLKDITNKNFVIPEELINYNILNKYFYNRVELYLLEKS